jgi:FkbM family methyltransferase
VRKLVWRVYQGLVKALRGCGWRRFRVGDSTLGSRLDLVIRRLLFAHAGRSVMVVHGHEMDLGPQGCSFFPEFSFDSYEEGTSRLFGKLIDRGMTVVDAGAHIGYYTLLAARLVGPSGRVYAFEPDPYNYGLLVKNIDMNRYGNVTPAGKAISNRAGAVTLFVDERHFGSSLFPSGRVGRRPVIAEATTLDDFFEREGWPQVHVMKMDIEGAELAALEGARRLLHRNGGLKLIVEFSPENLQAAGVSPQAFLDKLVELGFRVRVIASHGDLEPADTSGLLARLEGGHYVNLLCEKWQVTNPLRE